MERSVYDDYLHCVGEMASKYKFHVFAQWHNVNAWYVEKDGKRILSNQSIEMVFAFFMGYIEAQKGVSG